MVNFLGVVEVCLSGFVVFGRQENARKLGNFFSTHHSNFLFYLSDVGFFFFFLHTSDVVFLFLKLHTWLS